MFKGVCPFFVCENNIIFYMYHDVLYNEAEFRGG